MTTVGMIVEWETTQEYEFGFLEQGKSVSFDFSFRNISDEILLIDNVRTSCGCTVPDWPEYPILPDSTALIKVHFDAKKVGPFRKRIRVFFNRQRKAEVLTISGEVVN